MGKKKKKEWCNIRNGPPEKRQVKILEQLSEWLLSLNHETQVQILPKAGCKYIVTAPFGISSQFIWPSKVQFSCSAPSAFCQWKTSATMDFGNLRTTEMLCTIESLSVHFYIVWSLSVLYDRSTRCFAFLYSNQHTLHIWLCGSCLFSHTNVSKYFCICGCVWIHLVFVI